MPSSNLSFHILLHHFYVRVCCLVLMIQRNRFAIIYTAFSLTHIKRCIETHFLFKHGQRKTIALNTFHEFKIGVHSCRCCFRFSLSLAEYDTPATFFYSSSSRQQVDLVPKRIRSNCGGVCQQSSWRRKEHTKTTVSCLQCSNFYSYICIRKYTGKVKLLKCATRCRQTYTHS